MLVLEGAVGLGSALICLCLGGGDARPDIGLPKCRVVLECAGVWRLGNPYKTRLQQLWRLWGEVKINWSFVVTSRLCSSAKPPATPARGFANAKHRCASAKSRKPPAREVFLSFVRPTTRRQNRFHASTDAAFRRCD